MGVFKAVGRDQGVAMDEQRVSELIAEKGERYESLAAAGEMLFPGAADFIRIGGRGIGADRDRIGRADARDRGRARARRACCTLFPVIVGADQTERSKPHPDPYQTAFDACARTADGICIAWRSVAIEDSHWGLVSARGADLRCVAVTNTYSAAELRADAELVVAGLEALTLDALDALCAD